MGQAVVPINASERYSSSALSLPSSCAICPSKRVGKSPYRGGAVLFVSTAAAFTFGREPLRVVWECWPAGGIPHCFPRERIVASMNNYHGTNTELREADDSAEYEYRSREWYVFTLK